MSKLSFTEKLTRAFASGSMPEIKGKTRITLTEESTGKKELYEDSNMITNAISRIFKSNMLGLTDYYSSNFIPTRNLFGGCMLFSNPLTEDPDNIWPVNQNVSAMTANAGQTPHSSASPTRGNPDGVSSETTGDHIKMVWNWSTSQGNGPISCVCLTSSAAGDCGILPDGSLPLVRSTGLAFNDINIFQTNTLGDNNLTRSRALALPISIDSDGNGISLYLSGGNSLEEITTCHAWVTAPLIEGNKTHPYTYPNYRELGSRTATLSRTFTANYTMIAQDSTNYYVMERDSGNNKKLWLDIVAKSDMSVTGTSLTITDAGITLARPTVPHTAIYNGIVSGGSIYWISGSDAKKFVRINISNVADVEELGSNLASNISVVQTPIVLSDGLIVGKNYLINADKIYPITGRSARSSSSGRTESIYYDTIANYNGPHMLQSGYRGDSMSYEYSCQAGLLVLPYLATINNLQNPVTKGNTKSMTLEYVLTEE